MNLSVPQPLYQIKILKNLALPPPSFLFAWNPALQIAAGFLGFRHGKRNKTILLLHKSKLVVKIGSSAVKKIFFMYDMKKENSNYEKAVFLFHDQMKNVIG